MTEDVSGNKNHTDHWDGHKSHTSDISYPSTICIKSKARLMPYLCNPKIELLRHLYNNGDEKFLRKESMVSCYQKFSTEMSQDKHFQHY